MRILMVTTEYPTPEYPGRGVFVKRQTEALRAEGLDIDVLHFISRANPKNHHQAWLRMREMMAKKRYDLVHAQFGHGALIARMQLGTPMVVTYRGDGLQGVIDKDGKHIFKGKILVTMCQFLGLLADEVIVVSRRLGQILWRNTYEVIPSGLDLDRFRPVPQEEARRELGWDPNGRYVMFATQDLTWGNKRYPLAKAVVERVARDVECELKVITKVPPDTMPLYYSASDALLLLSIQEGSPNVVKEALACNLPVFATDVGDVRERLEGVQPGRVVKPTVDDVARALLPVMQNPVRSNGRESVQQLADKPLAERVVKIYERVLAY